MPKINLTAQAIPHLAPDEYYDSNPKGRGLILRVLKTGSRRFEFRYRFAGKYKRFHLGDFPGVSLSKARNKLLPEVKGKLSKGIDPQAELERRRKQEEQRQREEKNKKTFNQLVEDYKAVNFHTLREATRQEYDRIIDQELIPAFGGMAIADITTKRVIEYLDTKASTPTMANRIRSRLHTIFEHATGRYIDENPVSDTKRYKGEKTAERVYNDEELRNLWDYFETLNQPVQSYLKIITLTGQRRTETLKMRWNHIKHVDDKELTGWVWTIPAKLSKSDKGHEVPLSDLALQIIKELPKTAENPFVFASYSDHISLSTVKRAVSDIKKNCVSDFKLHDMRRTVSTRLAGLGVPQEVNSKVLNHKTKQGGALAGIYNRYEYRKERQTALNKWAKELFIIIADEEETTQEATIHKLG